jgi:hypothetical protein
VTWSKIPFAQALSETEDQRRHLLLGNGFSIEPIPIFRYPSLMAEASRLDRTLRDLFLALENPADFEVAIARARNPDEEAKIRKSFADTIARVHPRRNPALTPDAMASCAQFLARFPRGRKSRRGKIFTTNYDFVLSWIALEHRSILRLPDGFDNHGVWRPGNGYVGMHYLHGAMHIFRTGRRLTKLMSDQKQQLSLVQVARSAVLAGNVPVIVSGGSANDKIAKIRGEEYLYDAFNVFWRTCCEPGDALFVYGHSLSPVDSHITNLIGRGRIARVFVSVFDSAAERRLDQLATEWASMRPAQFPLEVRAFPSEEVAVWKGIAR